MVDTFLQTHFFAGGSWKVWLLELEATPFGAKASLALVLSWKGVQGRPLTLPRILGQHPLARLHLTS